MRRFAGMILLQAGLAVFPSYLWAYKLTGPSDAPTATISSTLLVNRAAYDYRLPYSRFVLLRTGEFKHGDLVQVRHVKSGITAFKRIIGMPGETVEFRENRVLINQPLLSLHPLNRADFNWVAPENHIGSAVYDEDGHWVTFTPGEGKHRNQKPVLLGKNEYFLVGDNRDQSADSRDWGPITEPQILGKVVLIIKR